MLVPRESRLLRKGSNWWVASWTRVSSTSPTSRQGQYGVGLRQANCLASGSWSCQAMPTPSPLLSLLNVQQPFLRIPSPACASLEAAWVWKLWEARQDAYWVVSLDWEQVLLLHQSDGHGQGLRRGGWRGRGGPSTSAWARAAAPWDVANTSLSKPQNHTHNMCLYCRITPLNFTINVSTRESSNR